MFDQNKYIGEAFFEMKQQNELYRSSRFWEEACYSIYNQIKKSGLENFRREIDNLNFFVPTYGPPGNSFSEEIINKLLGVFSEKNSSKPHLAQQDFLNGKFSAFSDYRVYKTAQNQYDKLNLSNFSESSYGNPIEHFEFDGKFFSRSSLNYLLGMSYLKRLLPDFLPQTVLEIGGGFGTLGEILHKTSNSNIKYIDVDLPPMYYIAHEYIKNACSVDSNDLHLSSLAEVDSINVSDLPLHTFLPSWEIEKLHGTIDLFVNFISFQEMEPEIVKNYLKIVSTLNTKIIMLRNMKEGKQKATKNSVGVLSPIKNIHYAQFLPDYELIGDNIIPFGFTTVDGFNSELLVFRRKA